MQFKKILLINILITILTVVNFSAQIDIDVYLENTEGVRTTIFSPGDEIQVVFYSGDVYNVIIDATLYYPDNIFPPKVIKTKYTINGRGKTIPFKFSTSPNDPEGLYNLRIIFYDTNGNFIKEEDVKFELAKKELPILPIALGGLLVVVLAGIGVAYVVSKKKTAPPREISPTPTGYVPPSPPGEETEVVQPGTVPMTVLATLEVPTGEKVYVTEPVMIFGREDFQKYLPRDVARAITRKSKGGHFKIMLRQGKFYIQDLNSTNGTLLNGEEISGRGSVELKDGDIISPAGIINITFKASYS